MCVCVLICIHVAHTCSKYAPKKGAAAKRSTVAVKQHAEEEPVARVSATPITANTVQVLEQLAGQEQDEKGAQGAAHSAN